MFYEVQIFGQKQTNPPFSAPLLQLSPLQITSSSVTCTMIKTQCDDLTKLMKRRRSACTKSLLEIFNPKRKWKLKPHHQARLKYCRKIVKLRNPYKVICNDLRCCFSAQHFCEVDIFMNSKFLKPPFMFGARKTVLVMNVATGVDKRRRNVRVS